MPDKKIEIWLFTEAWLDDLTEPLASFFGGEDWTRDYEDTWEWIAGRSEKYSAEVNISREHRWGAWCADKPVIFTFKFDQAPDNEAATIKIISKKLSCLLNTTVSFGHADFNRSGKYSLTKLGKIGCKNWNKETTRRQVLKYLSTRSVEKI